jgi:two-component system response regulator AtoC
MNRATVSADLEPQHARDALFLTESPAGRFILEQIAKAAAVNQPVLITGETGTGKELLARAIHKNRGTLSIIDCTRLSKELADRELFGHVRGAYTGADQSLPGLLQEANGGTAFFDEIGELPFDIQGKLLRVLQEKEIRPVGSHRQYSAEFRVIAATNRDLKQEIAAGHFRQDLYYRLNVIRIVVPPLRQRPEDIRMLLRHYSSKYHLTVTEEARSFLLAYKWPGNVRELESAFARAAVNARSSVIGVEDLSATITGRSADFQMPAFSSGISSLVRLFSSLEATTTRANSEIVSECCAQDNVRSFSTKDWKRLQTANALVTHRGNRKQMASDLKVSRSTLGRRLKELDKDERFRHFLEHVARSDEPE